MIRSGEKNAKNIIKKMRALIEKEPSIKIDYISIVDTKLLKSVPVVKDEVLIALAAFAGKTRLIDNIIVNPKELGKIHETAAGLQ